MDAIARLDSDCSAMAGLFQIIVNDLRNSGPMWEDFLTKASKLQHALKSTLVVFSSFLDAFQRIADSATHTRGATKDVGAALTRLSLRHRAIETRIKNLTNTLASCVVVPLQEKLDEWKRAHHALDKEHTKEYKRARADIKKRRENAARLQKKAKKAGKGSELSKVAETTVGDLLARYGVLEETERSALKHALTEERARYCTFALALKPVLEEEVGLVSELTHIQEVMEQLEKHSADPYILPAASEQVLEDVKSGDSKWTWQTPPSSPASSLGSRKSSMCSISSLNSSSSSSTHSPSHHVRARSGLRLVSGSSQDSGFTSQDMLNRPIRPVSFAFPKASGLSETSVSDGSHTPSPAAAPATATWPNLTDSTLQHKSASATGLHVLTDRPHTISSAYERGKDRPPLTVYTFQPPDGRSGAASPQISSQPVSPVCYEMESGSISPLVGLTATISRRSSKTSLHHNMSSSSQESLNNKPKPPIPNRCASLERPSIPDKKASVRQMQQQQQHLLHTLHMKEQHTAMQKESEAYLSSASESPSTVPDFHKAAPDMILPQPLYSNMSELNDLAGSHPITILGEMNESDGSSHASIGSSGYGSQPNMVLDHMSRLEDCEASRYCTLRPHSLAVFPQFLVYPSQDYHAAGFISSRTGSLRRGQKPPPPVRRSSSITPATSTSSLAMSPFSNNGLSASTSNASLTSSTSTVLSSPLSGRSNESPVQNSSNDSSADVSPPQKTDSESSTPVGSMENLPPPPAFLLEESSHEDDGNDNTTPEGILCTSEIAFKSCLDQEGAVEMRRISVSDTVKSLQESCHQPSSPITHRRTQSLRASAPPVQLRRPVIHEERKHSLDGPRAALISSLNAKLAISNPLIGSLQRQISPIQRMIPIYAQNPLQKGNLSPKLHRSKLTSVQEDVAYGNNNQTSSFIHIKEVSSFKGKLHATHTQLQGANPSGNISPRSSAAISRVDNIDGRSHSKRQSSNHDPFIKSLNMVLAQRATGVDQPTQPLSSPRTRQKRKPGGSQNGASSNTSLQRSGSSASEKTSKVRSWISSKKSVNTEASTAFLRESLLDQIRKGTVLRRPKHVADRSAPRVH